MLCPVCNHNLAIQDRQLGILPCWSCRNRQKEIKKPDRQVEFTSEEIKEGRRKYFASTIQRFRDGQLSRELVERYPERAKAMVEEGIITEKDIKKAKNVWSDIAPLGGDWIDRTK